MSNRLPWRASRSPATGDGASLAALGRMLASILFMVSGLVQCLVLFFPTHPDMNRAGVAAVGIMWIVIGLLLNWIPVDLLTHRRSITVLFPFVFGLIGLRNYFVGDGPEQYTIFFLVCYVWLGVARARGTSTRT